MPPDVGDVAPNWVNKYSVSFTSTLYFKLFIVLKYLLLRCPDITFDILGVLTSYMTYIPYVPEFQSSQCQIVINQLSLMLLTQIGFLGIKLDSITKTIDWKSTMIRILASVILVGNYTKLIASSSMRDFEIIKKFNINIDPPKAPTIKEIIWHPLILNWIKCNTPVAFTSSASSCEGMFRTS